MSARRAIAIGVGVWCSSLPLFALRPPLAERIARITGLPADELTLATRSSRAWGSVLQLLVAWQVGAWLRRGDGLPLTRDALRSISPGQHAADIVVGAVVVGAGLGLLTALLTWLSLSRGSEYPAFDRLADRAGTRYARGSMTTWQFANAKLRSDPIYAQTLCEDVLASGGTLVDIGCSQGLMLALLAEARCETAAEASLPRFEHLIGVEVRAAVAQQAREALGNEATILEADATTAPLPACDAVLIFDVLHLLSPEQQWALLKTVAAALRPGGTLLVREANPHGGAGFAIVRTVNRLKRMMGGDRHGRLTFRDVPGWVRLFRDAGFEPVNDPDAHGPLNNVLYRLRLY
ncbi:MAG: class I SAM-dependent methyltransferase [Acidobacteria bacterium]|nr:class I SAM-dependent methyltransferase [Acidobacteriota bacterium]